MGPPDTAPPNIRSLRALAAAEAECTRCPLYKPATQVVPGEGPVDAPLMMVGEAPGNDEDLTGKPFVGPAGRVLDRALADAGIDRKKTFVANAVKHFKFEPRGKRRLHKRPDAYEIERCRWWYAIERKLLQPKLVVALGATAVRSVFGRPLTITATRGKIHKLAETSALATIHPSYLLRIEDKHDKAAEYRRFVADLKLAVKFLAA